ncbi:SRPBCC domain-containing protein [Salinimicrobium sp. TIG7-5_MAKvit]|uniref:SRPBCC domain-containing protein n=1 Tax=Salinimicrobium sp. TIG7-5_MAKvit TaxID=3121289 RepID=UPI003C6DD819
MEALEIKTNIQIARSQRWVFDAITEPEKMSSYFISHASGRMEEGQTVLWTFSEAPESFPVRILMVKPPKNVIFEWDGAEGYKTTVEIVLEKISDNQTLVKLTEGKIEANEAGIKWYGENSGGWMNFLDCLKAYTEYGINLRKGAFDFMKK